MPNQVLNQDLYDALLKQSLDILRLGAGEQNDVADTLDTLAKNIKAELSDAPLDDAQSEKLKGILEKINERITEVYDAIAEEQEKHSEEIAKNQYDRTEDAIKLIFREGEELAPTAAETLTGDFVDTLVEGLPLSEWWSEQAGDLVFKVIQQVKTGIVNGETIGQIFARVVGTQTETGVMDTAKQYARTLVHTSVQASSNVGRQKSFQKNDDVIKGIEQVSTLDSHTSNVCKAYSGARWNLDYEPIDGNKLPYNNGVPRHWNCRSVEVPITKTFAELGIDAPEPTLTTRASELGQIDAKTTFSDFLDRMGTEYQDETLGAGKAQLWRDGKITLADLVNGQGRELTLEELKAKYDKSNGA